MHGLLFSQIRDFHDERHDFHKALTDKWAASTLRANSRVRYITAEHQSEDVSWATFTRCVHAFVAELKAKGAVVVAVLSDRAEDDDQGNKAKHIHFHAVVWMPRKWRFRYIRSMLGFHKLRPCGQYRYAIQRVDRTPWKLWNYLAGHIDPVSKYELLLP